MGDQGYPGLHREHDRTGSWKHAEERRNGGQRGMLGKEREWERDGERARGRPTAVVCIPWVPFNSVNVPGWRQESSSIIKLVDTRGWARNLKAIYRGRKVELWGGRSGAGASGRKG